MKNMHILPTDKPSMLFKDDFGNLIYSINMDQEQNHFEPQHLVTTSDEEIKDAKWIIHNGKIHEVTKNKGLYISVKEVSHIDIRANLCKKIILTTDPDLIKDGVQAIDDEFLEWFVKNPSCEEIEVTSEIKAYDDQNRELDYAMEKGDYTKLTYKIIIPKEEPKQETPEEAAERFYPIPKGGSMWMPSEDDLNKANKQEGFIEGAKWQAERRYSEEEVRTIAKDAYSMGRNNILIGVFNKWFEQFKKK